MECTTVFAEVKLLFAFFLLIFCFTLIFIDSFFYLYIVVLRWVFILTVLRSMWSV